MYGDKCCYIHPSIPCKYGFYCTRIGCAYSHPAGFNPGMGMYPNMIQPIPFKKHKAKHSGAQGQEKSEEVTSEKKEENKNDVVVPNNTAEPEAPKEENQQQQ